MVPVVVAINYVLHCPIVYSFPLNYYVGATIILYPQICKASSELKAFGIDIEILTNKYFLNERCMLFRRKEEIEHKYEFYEYIANVIQTAEQRVDIWRRSSSRTVQYLFHLYSDPDYLEKVLSSKGSWRLYTTDGGFFYMAPEGEIESHRPSEDNAHEETIGPERLFGGQLVF